MSIPANNNNEDLIILLILLLDPTIITAELLKWITE